MKKFRSVGDSSRVVGGNTNAALLLHYMLHAYGAGVFMAHGEPWHARTKAEMMHDVGFKRDRYDRALQRLIEGGFVKVQYGPHPFMPRKLHCTWFQITVKTVEAFDALDAASPYQSTAKPAFQKAAPPAFNKEASPAFQNAGLAAFPIEEILEDNTEHNTGSDIPVGMVAKGLKITKELETMDIPNNSPAAKQYAKSVSDLMKEMKPGIKVPEHINTVKDFEKLWAATMAKKHPSYVHLAWSGKSMGYAKILMKHMKEQGLTPLQTPVGTIIGEWSSYIKFCETSGASKYVPARPNIGYVAGAASVVIEWLTLQSTPKKLINKPVKTL